MGKNSAIPKNLYTYLYDFECLKILKENVFDTYFFPSSVPIHHSIAFEATKNYTFFDILAKCALYWWIQVPEIKSRNTTWVKRFFILAFSIFDKFLKNSAHTFSTSKNHQISPIIVKIFSKVALKLSFLHETSKFKSKIRVFWYSTQIHHYCYVHTTSHKVIHSHQISLYLALASSNEISFI